ncbi:hypothetical protein IE077_000685, partial [Cardiosporidium cionae]
MSEIKKTFDTEITPALQELQKEKEDYGRWVTNNEEVERLRKYEGAWKYYMAKKVFLHGEQQLEQLQTQYTTKMQHISEIDSTVEELEKEKNALLEECSIRNQPLADLRKRKEDLEKGIASLRSDEKCIRKDLAEEEKNFTELEKEVKKVEKRISDISTANSSNTAEVELLQQKSSEFKEEIQRLENRLASITTGFLDGTNPGTLRDQMKTAKSQFSQKEAEIGNLTRTLLHDETDLKLLQQTLSTMKDTEWKDLQAQKEVLMKHIQENCLLVDSNSSLLASLQEHEAAQLSKQRELETAENELNDSQRSLAPLRVAVQFPPSFDSKRYFGQFFDLFELKEGYELCAPALE